MFSFCKKPVCDCKQQFTSLNCTRTLLWKKMSLSKSLRKTFQSFFSLIPIVLYQKYYCFFGLTNSIPEVFSFNNQMFTASPPPFLTFFIFVITSSTFEAVMTPFLYKYHFSLTSLTFKIFQKLHFLFWKFYKRPSDCYF